jgi:hypothetical protein
MLFRPTDSLNAGKFKTIMLIKITLTSLAFVSVLLSGTANSEEHSKHKDDHKLAKDVDAFHSVLSPLWHAAKGKERTANICSRTAELENLSKGIQSTDARKLQASIAALKEKCRTNPLDIEAVFSSVHDEFHHIEKH